MADIKWIREVEEYGETWYDILYAKSNRLCTYLAEDLPKTAKEWLKGRPKKVQYNKALEREEALYMDEPVYRVEYDFYTETGRPVHAYLDNNGEGFNHEDAVSIGRELMAQGNRNVAIITM